MARMLGHSGKPRCPVCRASPGPDCGDKAITKRTARRREERLWRRELATLAD